MRLNNLSAKNLIEFVISLLETLLGFRIILKFLGASPEASFTNWIYVTTEPLLHPLANLFPASMTDAQFYIEWTSIFALVLYVVIGYFFLQLLNKLNR